MSLPVQGAKPDYEQQVQDAVKQRERLTRTIKLLKRLSDSLSAGDPIPSLAEVLSMTGLPHPGTEVPATAIGALLGAAEAERVAVNRRIRLSRELSGVARMREGDDAPAAAGPTAPVNGAQNDELARLAKISPRELDGLPYGAIVLDLTGRIVAYNDAESRMARLPVEAVLGRNFFVEVAPCTRVKDFEGRFHALVAGEGPGLATFDFTFPFPFGAQRVTVMLTRGSAPGTVIMALLRR